MDIYDIDIPSLIPELYIKTRPTYHLVKCPVCGKKEAYIPIKEGIIKPYIICNRKNKCGAVISLFKYLKQNGISLKPHSKKIKIKFNFQGYNSKIFHSYTLNNLMQNFNFLSKRNKFIAIVTFIYNFSLTTDRKKLNEYYQSRKINPPKNIGFLSSKDIKKLTTLLLKNFPKNALYYFKLLKNDCFKFNFSEYSVIPSFDYYSNLISAVRLRSIHKTKLKEIEISFSRIAQPLPYPLNRNLLKEKVFYFCEGHIDALSLNKKTAIAIEGVNSINDNLLKLFDKKRVYILFDEDLAGRRVKRFFKDLSDNFIPVFWNEKLGKDINELLLNNNLSVLTSKIKKLRLY
jgi:5S rRNA maturation endonuclease (ribonuclease M5)